jgi:pimeloyl-ACP methyl ester carboxylesterase
MAADAVALIDELDVERAHVWGGSLGGMIAQELALEFPERVTTLVLGGTTGGLPRLDLLERTGLLHILEATLRSLRPASDPEQRVESSSAGSRRRTSQRNAGQETTRGLPSQRCLRNGQVDAASLSSSSPAHVTRAGLGYPG